MESHKERIVFLDYLRVLACFMVMVIHAVEPFYFDGEMNLHIATKSDAFWVAVIDSAARACVPLFVMTSCYLLFPLKVPALAFFRRRAMRILVPFFVWSCVYVWRFGGSLKELLFNFPAAAGHLWFVPMLFGLYLAMPLFSPWAEKASKRELGAWIALWSVTATFPYLRRLAFALGVEPSFGEVAYLWGECPWNGFGAFQYVGGFFGYMLMALYIRRFVPEFSWRKTLAFALPLFASGLAVMAGGFYLRIPGDGAYPVHEPYAAAVDLEMSIEYCSLGVAAAAAALFVLSRKFTAGGFLYRRIVLPASEASFGAYLIHILVLVPVSSALKGVMPMPICVFAVAAISFLVSIAVSCAVRRLPLVGKWLMG
jgi:surface polysaccharide O-acyltransferase-like enzyme